MSERSFGYMASEEVRRVGSKAKVTLARSLASHVCAAKVTLRQRAQAEAENTADFLLH